MGRLACVDLPFFPLQVLFREHPEWREFPAAVVDRDEATGRIRAINEAARLKGVRTGLSYSQALSLAGDLRAAPVSEQLLGTSRHEVIELLYTFTPEVEPCSVNGHSSEDEGSFWLNAAGLEMLYPSLSVWMEQGSAALASRGFLAVIAVGFTRFGSYVLARSRRRSTLLQSEHQEELEMRKAPVRILPLSPATRALLLRLGIETLGAFLDLPKEGVARRFGKEAQELFRWAHRDGLPLQPVSTERAVHLVRRFEHGIGNLTVLTASVAELLDELLQRVGERQRLLAAALIELFDGEELRSSEEIRPAAPTRDASVLTALSRLRLAEQRYAGAVDRIEVSAEEVAPLNSTGELFTTARQQAAAAGKRAFALIRARFGNDAVRHALLEDEHLPERSYRWATTLDPLFPARSTAIGTPTPGTPSVGADGEARPFRVVRRLYEGEAPPAASVPSGGLSPGGERGPGPAARPNLPDSFRLIAGPFVYTGRWWEREERREYYFARSRRGGLLWLYRDEGEWIIQGVVD